MRYVILGTAGHIDHGKSQLVKALTGVDPDRLKEEKERGITIDIGFAELEYPEDGLSIGIVDVPGHERLIRNMLAGAGGIDLVLLVIAADEGIMPQSREHLHICDLLRIKSGVVAVTKTDLVEPDWLELVTDEVRGFIKGTFLEGAEIVPVSSRTGANLDELKGKIREAALGIEPKPTGGLLRLPIDRVFTLRGFGTVVTGTAVSGTISVDEPVEVLPRGISSRVRGLHSHGRAVREAYAGQRVAVNLQGVEKEDLTRGDTLVAAGRFSPTYSIDAKVELLGDSPPLKNRGLVHFHMSTSETVARAIIYGKDRLGPGEDAYCQFRLKDPVVAQCGDRYIIRRFSPLQTMGGGEVLDPSPSRRRKKDGIDDLGVFDGGTLGEKIAMKVRKSSIKGMAGAEVEGWIKAEASEVRSALGALKEQKALMEVEGTFIHEEALKPFRDAILKMLDGFHNKNPLKRGLPKEEARARLRIEPRVFGGLLASVPDVIVEKDLLRLRKFRAAVPDAEKERVLALLDKRGFHPPTTAELAGELSQSERQAGDILGLMQQEGSVVRISDSMCLSGAVYERLMGLLRRHFEKKSDMTVAEFRDILGTTRKYALPFLEYLDSHNITLRVGDVRKLILK
jgi:selenocysteine-specific elongation factor